MIKDWSLKLPFRLLLDVRLRIHKEKMQFVTSNSLYIGLFRISKFPDEPIDDEHIISMLIDWS